MAKKPLSDKVCQRRLTKWIEENYNEHEQEYLAYYEDEVNEKDYRFIFDNPITGEKRINLVIKRNTGEVLKYS